MSSPPAIRVIGLSKLYHVGARQQGYKTLRESIADDFWSPLGTVSRWERAGARADINGAAGRLSRSAASSPWRPVR